MSNMSGEHVCNVSNNYISLPTLHRGDNFTFVRVVGLPRTKDIWVPHCTVSPDHFTYFSISRIEALFQVGDKLLKVETSTLTSRILSWKQ
jgi:hypothetical protein